MPFKKYILASLFIAFGFFIAHDFIIVDMDADTQSELCMNELYQIPLDIPSSMHEVIHFSMLAINDVASSTKTELEAFIPFEEVQLFSTTSYRSIDHPPTA